MTLKPYSLSLGSGADLRGGDVTKAAVRAVQDAIHRSTLFVLEWTGSYDQLVVEVTVGVPDPESVRAEEVLAVLPVGRKSLKVVPGGLAVTYREEEADPVILASAAVRVSVADFRPEEG